MILFHSEKYILESHIILIRVPKIQQKNANANFPFSAIFCWIYNTFIQWLYDGLHWFGCNNGDSFVLCKNSFGATSKELVLRSDRFIFIGSRPFHSMWSINVALRPLLEIGLKRYTTVRRIFDDWYVVKWFSKTR